MLFDGRAPEENFPVPIVDLSKVRPKSPRAIARAIDPDEPALLLFTSRTTGTPKGVVLSFPALQARIDANIAGSARPSCRARSCRSRAHFGHGLIGNSLTPLLSGGDIVLHPLGIPMANDLGRIIDEHKISFMSSVPTFR